MFRKTLALFALGLIAMASSNANAYTPALGQVVVTGNGVGSTQNLGFKFTMNTPSQVITALGVFQGNDTVTTAGDTITLVSLGATGNATPVVLATLVASTPTASGGYNYYNINPVAVTQGVVYEVYATFNGSTATLAQYDTGTVIPTSDINNAPQGINSYFGSVAAGPPMQGFNNILATNFLYGAAVPEPASIAMLGLGLVGFAAIRRKMVRNSA